MSGHVVESGRILILGASVRAAAASSRRAGLRPIGIDLFGDRDLAAIARAWRIEPSLYPEGLFEAAARAPMAPWIYTGGLENHPALIDRLATRRPLWGIAGEALRAARDPMVVADLLRSRGLPALEVDHDPGRVPRDGSWLVKPLASAGGRTIRPWTHETEPPEEPVYYQRWVPGPSHAALFLARPGEAELIGLTAQWLGGPGQPFAYRGSLGPISLPGSSRVQIARIGRVLAEGLGLLGLFGLDLVARDGRVWPVEINPRYPASAEVLEWITGRRLLDEHRRVFENDPANPEFPELPNRPRAVGKRILEAPRDCQAPELVEESRGRRPGERLPRSEDDFGILPPGLDGVGPIVEDGGMARIADIPQPGTFLKAGSPVLTLLQAGASPADCRARLERRLDHWRRRLEGADWRVRG